MKAQSIASIIVALGLNSVSASAGTGDNYKGLAVDAAGILYVANVSSSTTLYGNVKAFDLQGKLVPAKSINSSEINQPTGLAFDSYGKLWVAQSGSSTATHYAFANGAWRQDAVLPVIQAPEIKSPQALAVDGYNNVWLVNSDSSIPIFDFSGTKLMVGQPPSHTNAVAAQGPFVSIGEDAQMESLLGFQVLTKNVISKVTLPFQTMAVAFDKVGNQYVVFGNGQLQRCSARTAQSLGKCTSLGSPYGSYYKPGGMAVDLAHDRIYVSYTGIGGSWVTVLNSNGVILGNIN